MNENKIFQRIKNQLRNILFKKRFFLRFNHNPRSFKLNTGSVHAGNIQKEDNILIERLKSFYLICDANFDGNKDSQWTGIFNRLQGDIHEAFLGGHHEKITDILRNPGKYNLFFGFENLSRELINAKRLEDYYEGEMAMDSLLSTCEAAGAIKIANPESLRIKDAIDAEEAIKNLEVAIGISLSFPNPFNGEFGLKISKGIMSYRAAQAIYQAWRIFTIVKDIPNPSILEIGGGLGRTAYYCRLFGIKDYTIVDIPMSSLAQGNFLGRVLPENELHLMGETVGSDDINSKIKLVHTKAFFSSEKKYDLIINVDSMTELDIRIAREYLDKISQVSRYFLSINHENNSFTVNSIWQENSTLKRLFRYPYWVRRGYVEELFER